MCGDSVSVAATVAPRTVTFRVSESAPHSELLHCRALASRIGKLSGATEIMELDEDDDDDDHHIDPLKTEIFMSKLLKRFHTRGIFGH